MVKVLAVPHADGLGARLRGFVFHPYLAMAILCLELAFAIYIYVMVPSRELLPDLATYIKAAEALRNAPGVDPKDRLLMPQDDVLNLK